MIPVPSASQRYSSSIQQLSSPSAVIAPLGPRTRSPFLPPPFLFRPIYIRCSISAEPPFNIVTRDLTIITISINNGAGRAVRITSHTASDTHLAYPCKQARLHQRLLSGKEELTLCVGFSAIFLTQACLMMSPSTSMDNILPLPRRPIQLSSLHSRNSYPRRQSHHRIYWAHLPLLTFPRHLVSFPVAELTLTFFCREVPCQRCSAQDIRA
jgi:hypothetical protein